MLNTKKFFGLLLLMLSLTSWSYALSEISIRLNNPQYDQATEHLIMDVELKSNVVGQQAFGMNVRFFYDDTQLQFIKLDGLPIGYGILGNAPSIHVGNSSSGYQLFNMESAASYVNGAVQLLEPGNGLEIPTSGWTKFFELHFEVKVEQAEMEDLFYPTIILDSKGNRNGGFLRGEDGIVLTLVEQDLTAFTESKPSIVSVDNFNWIYNEGNELPFGMPVEQSGILLNNAISSTSSSVEEWEYLLFQNYPNPVLNQTSIRFYLPTRDQVSIRFFDVYGKEQGVLSGHFPSGYNSIDVTPANLLMRANMLFYRMEVGDYSSSSLKMIIADD